MGICSGKGCRVRLVRAKKARGGDICRIYFAWRKARATDICERSLSEPEDRKNVSGGNFLARTNPQEFYLSRDGFCRLHYKIEKSDRENGGINRERMDNDHDRNRSTWSLVSALRTLG